MSALVIVPQSNQLSNIRKEIQSLNQCKQKSVKENLVIDNLLLTNQLAEFKICYEYKKKKISVLEGENNELKKKNDVLEGENNMLKRKLGALDDEGKMLKARKLEDGARIKELEGQLARIHELSNIMGVAIRPV